MDADKLDRRLVERLQMVEAGTTDATIPVVIQCLGAPPDADEASSAEGQDAAEDSTHLAFRRLRERLSELGVSGDVREVPVSNALEVHLTPSQVRAVAAHRAVGRMILSPAAAAAPAPVRGRPSRVMRPPEELIAALSAKVIGQDAAIRSIVPYVSMYEAGLAPGGRPVGVFLLLGPTGTGKTRTVEAIAAALHGSDRKLVRIDCSEFQEEHEVAKLIGAPPGYIGHRETVPLITAHRLAEIASEGCDLAIVLFDEIEKAAPSLTRLLLGVLDRAVLRLGDGSSVNFEKTLIFLTSNLGARDMMKELGPVFGFAAARARDRGEISTRIDAIALAAVRKAFSPEFVNRIDAVVTYAPLGDEALGAILGLQIDELQQHVTTRLGDAGFTIEVPEPSRRFLLRHGASAEYGARELRRTVHRHLTQPLAALVTAGKIEPGSRVRVDVSASGDELAFHVAPPPGASVGRRRILVVDDNQPLLGFVRALLSRGDWDVTTTETIRDALAAADVEPPAIALVDYLLPDGNGCDLATELKRRHPEVQLIVMSGLGLPEEDEAVCRESGFALLPKPFGKPELLAALRRTGSARAAGAS